MSSLSTIFGSSGGGGGGMPINSLTPNTGGAVFPVGNNVNLLGTGVITTSNAGSPTLDINLTASTDGQLIIGAPGGAIWASLTAGTGIAITPGTNSITIAADTNVATTYDADTGSATPAANVITFAGGTGISTTAAGSIVTISASGGGGGTTVTTFDTSGTWTMGVSTKYVKVYGWNGGGGGGSGGNDNTSTDGGGGSGGAPGDCFYFEAPATYLPASVTVTIGAGGAGGASSAAGSPGNPGSPGGQTSFGNLFVPVTAFGGNGGTVLSGIDAAGVTAGFIYYLQQSDGFIANGLSGIGAGALAAGGNADPQGGYASTNTTFLIGTAGGGGAGSTNGSGRSGGHGGNILALDTSTVLLAGGLGGASNNPGHPGNDASTTYGFITGGTGGGGGGNDAFGVGGNNGGNGGIPGGGGGGAGGSTFGTAGAGGDGGHGRVIVVEFS